MARSSGTKPAASHYQEFTTPYAGLPQVIRNDRVYQSQQRFGMYRAPFWYQTLPTAPFPTLPQRDQLEVT